MKRSTEHDRIRQATSIIGETPPTRRDTARLMVGVGALRATEWKAQGTDR
jgi:hypothetical protein